MVYLVAGVRAKGNGKSKGFRFRLLTEEGTKLRERKSEIGVRNVIASVIEHLQNRFSTLIVANALNASFVADIPNALAMLVFILHRRRRVFVKMRL